MAGKNVGMSENDSETRRRRAEVAEEIQVLLLRRKSNPTQLAKRLGWSQSYISRRIVGDSPFDLDDLYAIAAALDVPITDLFPRRTVTGQYRETAPTKIDHAIMQATPLPRGALVAAGTRRTAPTGR